MPFAILNVVCYVAFVRVDVNVKKVAVESPTSEDHVTRLLVERKIFDVYAARALKDDCGEPSDVAIVLDNRICGYARRFGP